MSAGWSWTLALLLGIAGVLLVVLDEDHVWGGALVGAGLVVAAIAADRELRPRPDDVAERRREPAGDARGRAQEVVARRPVLTGGVVATLGVLVAGAMAALARFGPRRDPGTGWADGVRLVDPDGAPIRQDELAEGGIVVAWPEGPGRHELAAAIVVRLPGGTATDEGSSGAADLGAFSRICTHAGCPVALFRPEDGVVYCPCHQATFDVTRDATPIFGPASRPLPRLPIGTDADGFLVARGDFTSPPGPRAGGPGA